MWQVWTLDYQYEIKLCINVLSSFCTFRKHVIYAFTKLNYFFHLDIGNANILTMYHYGKTNIIELLYIFSDCKKSNQQQELKCINENIMFDSQNKQKFLFKVKFCYVLFYLQKLLRDYEKETANE